MPANIEIKAQARHFADIRHRAELLSDTPVDACSRRIEDS
jgi:hypothetical protein